MVDAMTHAFDHPALFYRTADEYLAGTVAFITAGLDAQQPVMVAVPGANLDLIRRGLGPAADRVQLRDMSVAGRNPGRILPGVLLAFAGAHPGQRVWIIGEPIWPGRTEVEYPACAQHEALINAAFSGRDAAILCPYDVTHLDQQVIDDAYRTHPVIAEDAARRQSPGYGDPAVVAAAFNRPLPRPPDEAATIGIDTATLAVMRKFLTDLAGAAGLDADRVIDLAMAVNELATNTLEHGGGEGTLAIWPENGHLVCQISDAGYIGDPLAGRIPAPPDQVRGRGLVLVNQVCDLVRIHTVPGATTIRLQMRR
jgi:anti-sigma regulatory factor (Ser/Thr protein kinase)